MNQIIQIIVTTSCDIFTCSNCTQLLPYRTDARFMEVDVFREAVRSLADWPGVIACFGGNPVVHPRFEELCAIMREEIPAQWRRGLWTNNLMQQGGVIRETFWPRGTFNLNVHGNEAAAAIMRTWLPGIPVYGLDRPSWHSPILMDYRDLGMAQEEWVALRERCDINQLWSAAIAQRTGRPCVHLDRGLGPSGDSCDACLAAPAPYAYFCEVGASLDGIRGENHGILAEPGWWAWGMDRFTSQVAGCCDRGCGVPLKFRGHLDKDETYDATRVWVDYMRSKAKRVKVEVHDRPGDRVALSTDYQRLFS